MTFSLEELLAIFAFSLVASISPGPVNLLILSTGVGHGWRRAMPLVVGASGGFTLLLGLLAAGLGSVWLALPGLQWLV
ncbi:LysE family translocator, partial [Halomonas sp. OfavH-34-E]|nr:LysE family translocator [Halomonas sp. OfavH-34-E]